LGRPQAVRTLSERPLGQVLVKLVDLLGVVVGNEREAGVGGERLGMAGMIEGRREEVSGFALGEVGLLKSERRVLVSRVGWEVAGGVGVDGLVVRLVMMRVVRLKVCKPRVVRVTKQCRGLGGIVLVIGGCGGRRRWIDLWRVTDRGMLKLMVVMVMVMAIDRMVGEVER
jgi:hypothetical protein